LYGFVCRLTTFQDNWPKIEKWYSRFGTLKTVDGTLPKLTTYLEVETIMDETLKIVGIHKHQNTHPACEIVV